MRLIPEVSDDEDVVPAYKTPSFVTADWSITLADLHATSTPSGKRKGFFACISFLVANKRVFVPDLSVQGREQYSLLSNSSVASLKDCMHNSEPRVTYVHTAVSPITKTQTQSPPPLPDPVHVDPVPFEECLPESEPEQPEPEPDPSVLSPVLKSPTAYSPPSLPYFPPTLPLPKVQTKAHDAGSPLTSIASDSDDEEHVSKMVVPSSVTPPIFSPIFTPPIRLKRLSDSPSRTPQTASKKRKLDMVPMPKKKRKIVWPEISVDTSSATKVHSCYAVLFGLSGISGLRAIPATFGITTAASVFAPTNNPKDSNVLLANRVKQVLTRIKAARWNVRERIAAIIILMNLLFRELSVAVVIEGRLKASTFGLLNGKGMFLSFLHLPPLTSPSYDISAATWQEENTIGDPRSLIRQFYKALQVAGVQNDPETRVILPSVRNRLPEDLLALFP